MQLIYGIAIGNFILQWIPNLFRRLFKREARRSRENSHKGLAKRSGPSSGRQLLQLDYLTAEQLEQNYASILAGEDLSNIDNSEDYIVSAEESDYESDAEVIDLTINPQTRGSTQINYNVSNSTPLQEIFDDDGLKEFLEVSVKTIYKWYVII